MKITASPRTIITVWLSLGLVVLLILENLPPQSSSLAQDGETIGQYEVFETVFEVEGEYNNPYDPNQVDVRGLFFAPDGTRIEVPGFFMQPYRQTCEEDCAGEQLSPVGDGEWHVRFTPTQVGRWRYTITARLNGVAAVQDIQTGRFTVEENPARGFIRIAPNNRYFMFEDGTPYFPIGQNLGWSWSAGGGVFTFIDWLDRLHASGANYAHVYMDVPWFIGLEWSIPAGQYGGAGQEAAWRLDTILQAAQARGIYLQLILIWHRAFQDYQGAPVPIPNNPPRPDQSIDFDSHPYNSRLAGSLNAPSGVFIDSVSQRLLIQRFRYIMARWGYSPQIFAWEMVDSLDQIAGFVSERDVAWLNTLIASVREYDLNHHLITVGTRDFNLTVQAEADIDFTQVRLYQNRPIEATGDQIALTLQIISEALALVDRPVLLTEFSLNRWHEPTADDPTGVHIQNTLWASFFAGAAGTAMPMWWDTYLDVQNFYPLYTPLRLFTQEIDWTKANFMLALPGLTGRDLEYAPLRLENFNRLFRSPSLPDTFYQVTADGSLPPVSLTSSYLYGRQFNAENSRPQSFIISPPVDTEFFIAIENVSTAADAQLQVTIDGQVRTALNLAAGTRELVLNFPLTAGPHTIVLDNLGQDWIQLAYLEVKDYIAPVGGLALMDFESGQVLVWLHHRMFRWDTILAETEYPAYILQLHLPQLPVGQYRAEIWDTTTGLVIGEEIVTVSEGLPFSLNLVPLKTQLALRIFALSESGAMPPPTQPQPTRTPVAN